MFCFNPTPRQTNGNRLEKRLKNKREANYAPDILYHANERVVLALRSSSKLAKISVPYVLPLHHRCSRLHYRLKHSYIWEFNASMLRQPPCPAALNSFPSTVQISYSRGRLSLRELRPTAEGRNFYSSEHITA